MFIFKLIGGFVSQDNEFAWLYGRGGGEEGKGRERQKGREEVKGRMYVKNQSLHKGQKKIT